MKRSLLGYRVGRQGTEKIRMPSLTTSKLPNSTKRIVKVSQNYFKNEDVAGRGKKLLSKGKQTFGKAEDTFPHSIKKDGLK